MERANFSEIKRGTKDIVPSHGTGVVVSRFVSFAPGTYNGQNPDRSATDLKIPVVLRLKVMTQQDVLDSNGYYELGEIETASVRDIVGYNSDQSNKAQGDFMIYDGFTYVLKGRPKRVRIAGRVETVANWRRA